MSGLPRIKFNTIVINPHDTNEIYIGTQRGIYRTKDAGFNWEHLGLDQNINTFLISLKEKSNFIVLTDSGLYSSNDAGKNWGRADSNLPKKVIKGSGRTAREVPISVNLVAYSNDNSGRLLVATPDGLFISKDEGIDKQFYKHSVKSFYSNKSKYYLGSKESIYKSDNSGESWSKIDLSDKTYNMGTIIGISDKKANGLMLNDDNGNIFYYRNDGKIISLNSGVLPHSKVYAIAAKTINDNKQRIYAFVKNNFYVDVDGYGIFFSEDDGLTWRKCLTYEKPYYANPRLYLSPINNEIWHFIKLLKFHRF